MRIAVVQGEVYTIPSHLLRSLGTPQYTTLLCYSLSHQESTGIINVHLSQ